jgi:hypothetical protein
MRRPFRPLRTVTDPEGDLWELYVSRIAAPDWREGGYNPWVDGLGGDPPSNPATAELMLLELPFAFVGFLWSSIVVPALRLLFLTPIAAVRGRRSHAARILAVCVAYSGGGRETRTWTTTIDQVESVLNEIANGLEVGKIVQPIGAVYSGAQDD